MKKNNKGFVFVETIVVITFLAASLIIIYAAFTNLLTSEKRRMYYDDPIYLYRSYYILDFLQKQDVNSYVAWMLSEENDVSSDNLLVEFSCNETLVINSAIVQNFCESIINNQHFSVEHIYFTYYDTTAINECTNDDDSLDCESHESLDKVSAGTLKYIRSLGGAGKEGYRMIVEYKETIDNEDRFYYSSVFLPTGDYDKANSSLVVFDKDNWTNYDKKVLVKVDETESGIKGIYVGPGTNCTNVIYEPYDGVREREYYFDNGSYVACFKDNNGHVTQNNYTITKVDKKPPLCTVEGENTIWTNNDVKLDFNCSEPDGTAEETSGCRLVTQHSNTYSTGSQETLEINYTVLDVAGNETKCVSKSRNTNIYNIYHDKDKPVVSFTPTESLSFQKVQSSKVSVTTSSTNFGSPVSIRRYLWNQSTTTPAANEFSQNFINNATISKNNGDGTWYLWIYTKDSAGNETIIKSGAFNLDNSPPVPSFSQNGGTSNYSHSTKVTVFDYNNLTTLKYVWSLSNTADASNGTAFKSGDTLSNKDLEGTYYLCIYAVDSLGMSSNTCSKGFAFSRKPIWQNYQTQYFYHNHTGNGGACVPCVSSCTSRIVRHDNRCGGFICEGAQHRCVNECSCGGKMSSWGNDNCNEDQGSPCTICLSYQLTCTLSTLGSATLQVSTNTGRTLYRVVYDNSSGYLSGGNPGWFSNSGSLANYNSDPETIYPDVANAVVVKSSGSFYVVAYATDTKTWASKSVTFYFNA
ncbi:MAG: hypothetical protein ACI31M_00760 [Bacilli bacterium]